MILGGTNSACSVEFLSLQDAIKTDLSTAMSNDGCDLYDVGVISCGIATIHRYRPADQQDG